MPDSSPIYRKYPSNQPKWKKFPTGPHEAQLKSQHHFSPKGGRAAPWESMWEDLCSLYILYSTIIFDIYKVSLDDSFTLSCGHSCRGLRGLVLDHISTHQLRNGVQIAVLIPQLGPAGGSSALNQPIGILLQQTSSLIDSQLTAASPLCVQHSLSTCRHFGTLYI